jgi:hypothetical protein
LGCKHDGVRTAVRDRDRKLAVSLEHSDRLWVLPSLLYSEYWGHPSRFKAADHLSPFNVKVSKYTFIYVFMAGV